MRRVDMTTPAFLGTRELSTPRRKARIPPAKKHLAEGSRR